MKKCKHSRAVLIISALAVSLFNQVSQAQAPQPNGAGVKAGVLPKAWLPGGPKCIELPEFQIQEYNEDLYIIRQSGCSHYEKPFLYLLFGNDKALLLDTGAGKNEVARAVKGVVDKWLARHKRESIQLVVAHSHGHRDHTAGDSQFEALAGTTVVKPNTKAVQTFFGINNWPDEIVQYNLGGRIIDVVSIPGHEESGIAVYDRQTGILFTGDTLYPGRLYVHDAAAFARGIQRLVDFTRGKIVSHILGTHIENARTPYLDYPVGTVYQPDEHQLELSRGHLLELNDALQRMNGHVTRMAMRDFTIWPE